MADELTALVASWRRSLRARNLAAKTLKTYTDSADQLATWLTDNGNAVAADGITAAHVEGFITHLLETRSAATASVRFRALQQWFAWLEREDEIGANPMAKLRPPTVPEAPVPVLGEAELRRLLKTCAGKDFVAKRDTAILRLFIDTGMRLSEMAGLQLGDIDLEDRPAVAFVEGKGRRQRACPFGARTELAVDRYLRERARHKRADLSALWLGANGRTAMTDNGIGQVVRKRGREAGLPDLHPHMLRHSWAHDARLSGLDDDALMRLAGWKSRQMLHRYGSSTADERARAARDRVVLVGDRI